MKNDKLNELIIPGFAEKMGYQSMKIPFNPLSGYYSIIDQLDQRLQLQIDPSQIDLIAQKLRLVTNEHIQKNADLYRNKLLSIEDFLKNFSEKGDCKDTADLAGAFAKYLESLPIPHITPCELEALAYVLNIRIVILVQENQFSTFNESANIITQVFISCDKDKNFYSLRDIQNPTAKSIRDQYNQDIYLKCREETPDFREGTFNLSIQETLTPLKPVIMTDFTPEHHSIAKKQGYTLAQVPRDGLCAYYAVIDQLDKFLNLNIIELSLAYNKPIAGHRLKKIAQKLRKLVSDHIIKNSHYYIPYLSQHFSVNSNLKKLFLPMAYLFTKELSEQETVAPHHELELKVLANLLNIRIIIFRKETYLILNHQPDTITTVWISQNQQEYGSLQPINEDSARLSRETCFQEIKKKSHHPAKQFASGTFSLPIRETLALEEKQENIPVDSKGDSFKEGIMRLFSDSPFRNSRVFKEIIAANNKSQLIKIIEKFLASTQLLLPAKTPLILKLETLLELDKPAEKDIPLPLVEEPRTAVHSLSTAPDKLISTDFYRQNYPFFLLPMAFFPTPMPALTILSSSSTPASLPIYKTLEKKKPRKRPQKKGSHVKLIHPKRLADISSAVKDLQEFFKERKLEVPEKKLMTIGKLIGGIKNLKTLKEKFDTLTLSGLALNQILRLASQASNHMTLAVFEGYFQDLKKLQFTDIQIMKLASHISGHLNLAAVKTHTPELISPAWGLSHDDIGKIAGHDGGSVNLKYFRELRYDPRLQDFSTEQIIRLAGRVAGSQILITIAENYPRLQSLGFSIAQTLKLSSCLLNITEILEHETALKELDITPEIILENFLKRSGRRLKIDELCQEIESRRRARPVPPSISPSPLLHQSVFLESKRTQNQTVAVPTSALTLNNDSSH